MLSLKNIVVHYGGIEALKDISLDVEAGAITSLIGANGAGKSTTLRAISGLVPLTSGEIWFEGKRIDGLEPEEIVELGISHVPEGKRLFLEMSVLDNLLAGAYLREDKDRLPQDLERIYEYFPLLRTARYRPASTLSGGEQQMLAIGRGLMSRPKLLLLDEPSLGLSPILTREVGSIIKRIVDEGVPILLIEQNVGLALQLAKKNYVMETGTITLEGNSKELQNNPHVKEAYLGISPAEEEVPYLGVPFTEIPYTGGVETRSEERWQDRGPQGRWQDRGPQAKWQDKHLQKGEIPARELQVEQPRVRQGEGSKVPSERPQEKEGVERLLGAGKVADRWPEERPAIERPREGIALPERRPPGKKPLSRVIKRTFVPVVRGVKIG
jgi:branched-chain amino acid transport system ATP-binding protein